MQSLLAPLGALWSVTQLIYLAILLIHLAGPLRASGLRLTPSLHLLLQVC